jgi:hypothetical protein
MSAMAAVIQHDRIHVLTDAVFYERDGTVKGFAPKVWPIPGGAGLYSTRGIGLMFDLFKEAAEVVGSTDGFSTWDEFKLHVETVLAKMDELVALRAPGHKGEVMLAGWSAENDRGEVLWRGTHDAYAKDGLAPSVIYVAAGADGLWSFGVDADDFPPAAEFDPDVHALNIFESGRAALNDLECREAAEPVMGHCVGGWLQHSTITADGMTTRALHRWPDVVGEKIECVTEYETIL